ncbi:UDP-glucose 4-epimerase-like [Anneissia japonica]|uniref:UDP-glucose 4-epimerase-like n=1 Tax=Anneissia japonica TaxID=1529436 RepID=UPI0014256FA6|nr:UDP-glucose 4-epimerase-like [Anneissia japonica]XP_033123666.1 UDP-glucose 4-epimerase-like [Anneissia japonica]XP_033123667.1 UDP-glucose 4-epimerase-like [Anneissia japonica]
MAAEEILVTGGAGYIGSHTVLELVEAGYKPVVVDNFVNSMKGSNGQPISICRVEEITGKSIPCYEVDILNKASLTDVFKKHNITSVIHLASLKAVGESIHEPLRYYKVNVGGAINLLEVMKEEGVKNIVFSSSATVYGLPEKLPLTEEHPVGKGISNPYGKTKFFIEDILRDCKQADKDLNVVILRYFNPVGSHKSGKLGEDPQGPPANLMPFVAQVAVGQRPEVKVFGNDYDTPDGTGVRDYIHIVDLAQGHVKAIEKLNENCGLKIYNLGSGKGYSVLEMVKSLEKVSGRKIPYKIVERRAGDLASVYADSSLAEKELNWKTTRGLDEMCEDLWRWQSNNPNGFKSDC